MGKPVSCWRSELNQNNISKRNFSGNKMNYGGRCIIRNIRIKIIFWKLCSFELLLRSKCMQLDVGFHFSSIFNSLPTSLSILCHSPSIGKHMYKTDNFFKLGVKQIPQSLLGRNEQQSSNQHLQPVGVLGWGAIGWRRRRWSTIGWGG